MQRYTAQEFEGMLNDLESDLAERQESFQGEVPNTVREAVCAFANDLPDHRRPGVVFVGAKDNGTPSGLTITDELLRQLADVKTAGNIVPPPTLTVEKRILHEAELAVFTVQPADSPPVRYRGRVYIRIGPRRGIASAQDERILNEKRRHRDPPFDVRPMPSAQLEDLDRPLFKGVYLPAAFAPDVLEVNDRSYEQRLAALKMVVSADEPVPTVLGLLVLGKDTRAFLPGAYVQFLRIDGLEQGEPIVDAQLIDGTITDVVRRTEDKFSAHNRTSVDFTSGPIERRHSDYPLAALQQLFRNAIMHRTYEGTHAPVHAYWYNDRIELLSPGGPYGTVTIRNFGEPGLADYRNPDLAEAMRVLGLVQRYGFGIPTARRELERNGNPAPEFRVDDTHVLTVIHTSA